LQILKHKAIAMSWRASVPASKSVIAVIDVSRAYAR
jgi:hypothetical protein